MTKSQRQVLKELSPRTREKVVRQGLSFARVDGGPIFDPTTGEVLDDLYSIKLTIKRTKKQYEAHESKRILGDHEKENGGFIFSFFKSSNAISERFPTLSNADIARLMLLGTYTAWSTGRLQYDGNGRAIKREAFAEIMGLSEKRSRELFVRFIDAEVLEERENGIYMNQTVFYYGRISDISRKIVDLQATRLFKKSVRKLYEKTDGRSIGQLAIVYSVLPFLNFVTNIVSHNPDETDCDLVQPMSLEKLAEILGYSNPQKLKTAMNRVNIDGKPVFGFFENPHDRREKRIVVNPRVVFAGNGEELGAIKALFN